MTRRRDPEPRLLTQGQAAAYCGVSVGVFTKACPIVPVKLLGRVPRYDRASLDTWLDSLSEFRPRDSEGDLGALWDGRDRCARQES
jgi:hypothetical protein